MSKIPVHSSDEDDDMPSLPIDITNRNLQNSDANIELASAEKNPVADAETGEENRHPASCGVLIPQKMFCQTKVHPGSIEPIIRDAKAASKLKEQGNEFFRNGKLRLAQECYTEALLTVPQTPDHDYSQAVYYGNRAACHLKMTLYEKCVADCTEAIKLSPKYVKVIMRRSKAFELQENLEAALEDLKKVLEIDPTYATARHEAIRLETAIKEKQEKMKDEVLGKLKSLGNTILGKFGMSLDNFKMKQAPDGSYSMSFNQ